MSNDENREKNEEKAAVPVQPIIDMGSTVVKNSRGTIHCLTIVGQVEGHTLLPDNLKSTKYEHVLPLLAALEQNEQVDGVLLLLNTVGGDIEAGLAIAELIAGMKKPTVSLVLGGGHSIGIPLAVSAKKSLIVPTASMTVHPVRMTGLVVGAPQTYQYFNQIQEQIVNFVTKNSHISREDFLRYMMATDEIATDVGTVLYGEEAVSSGLMDAIGSLSDALSLLHRQIERRRKREKSHNQ
jgi:ATP-dependent protease ClpP protease subunit